MARQKRLNDLFVSDTGEVMRGSRKIRRSILDELPAEQLQKILPLMLSAIASPGAAPASALRSGGASGDLLESILRLRLPLSSGRVARFAEPAVNPISRLPTTRIAEQPIGSLSELNALLRRLGLDVDRVPPRTFSPEKLRQLRLSK